MKIDFEKIKDLKVVCVGDLMLDEFVQGSVNRISPEAPVPVLKSENVIAMLGGVGNVVANLHELGAKVTLFSTIGEDANGKKLLSMLGDYKNLEAYISVDKAIRTTTKTRFVSGKQHMLRHDQESKVTFTEEAEAQIIQSITDACQDADVLIVSDYNKGYMTDNIKFALARMQTKAYKIVDSKGTIGAYSNGFDLITPNIKELENFTMSSIVAGTSTLVDILYKMYSFPQILVTASEKGMYLYEKTSERMKKIENPISKDMTGAPFVHYEKSPVWRVHSEPAYNSNPVDVSGAGDTVVAAIAVGKGLGLDYQYILEFASHCSAISVSKRGTSTVTVDELKARYNEAVRDYGDVLSVQRRIKSQKQNGRSIGLVNGCFDIIHSGHLKLLKQAKEHCQYLVVAVNSDTIVKQLKGDSRPINDEATRCEMLASLKYVDDVVIFDEEEPTHIISELVPDMVFKGKEYEGKALVEQIVIDQLDIGLVFLETNDHSTTKIINKIQNG